MVLIGPPHEPLDAALDDDAPAEVRWERRVPDGFGHAVKLAAEAAEEGHDRVVAVGGDGTLNEVLQGLMSVSGPRPPLGLVPGGTANDFARQHDAPLNDPRPWLIAAVGPARPIDLGRAGPRYFANVSSIGFAAQVSDSTPEPLKRSLGRLSYIANALAAVGDLEPVDVRLRGPGLKFEGPVYGVFVGNGRQAGGGFQVCAEASMHDGLLDVLIVPHLPLGELGIVAGEALLGAPHLHEHTEVHRLSWLELEADGPVPISLDGERLSLQALRYEAIPDALMVALPAERDDDDTADLTPLLAPLRA